MPAGIDTNEPISAKAAAELKAGGFDFVARYLKPGMPRETLTAAEAKGISAAGLSIVSIWEDGYPTSAGYFSREQGVADGAAAYKYARGIGQPVGSAIYACVDYDATAADIAGRITAYFQGFRTGMQQAMGESGEGGYLVGVYGSGAVCSAMLAAGLAHYAWASESRGFLGTREFIASGKAALVQSASGPKAGLSCDGDVSNGAAGGWRL